MSILATVVALVSTPADIKISEVLMPRSDSTAFAAVLSTQGATDGELAALNALARTWEQGSRVYTRLATASAAGVVSLPKAEVGDGYILLRLEVRKSAVATGAQMLASLLTEPALDDDAVGIAQATSNSPADVQALAWSSGWFRGAITAKEIEYAWRKFVRPERITVCAAGEMPLYTAEAALKQATWTWPALPERRLFLRHTRDKVDGVDGEASIWTLQHPAATNGKSLAVAGLTACLLGIGKESAMFKVLRTDLAYSYRQEALAMPTAKGWNLGLVAYSTQKTSAEVVTKQRSLLAERVRAWTELDLTRVRRQWSSHADGIFPFGPFWSSGESSLGNGPWAEAGLGALTQAQFGATLSQAKLLQMADNVTLDEVKQMALATLDQGQVRLIPAR